VLFVTYHFPPSGSSKTRRTLKFLKYLPQFSWYPVVLTVSEGKIFNFDPSLLDEVPQEIPVYRTKHPAFFFRRRNLSSNTNEQHEKSKSAGRFLRSAKNRVVAFLKQWLTIPDAFITWLPWAFFKGICLIRHEGVEMIYSTGPPFSNHVAAALLRKCTRTPLVLDFRDAWIADPVREWKYTRGRRAIEALLEGVVIRSADLVVATTEGIAQDFCTRYPKTAAQKFVTIPNGYDREDFQSLDTFKRTCSDKMLIVHTGYLLMERSPKPFLIALRRLFDERPDLETKIEVYFVGESSRFLDGKSLEEYIQQYKLDAVVRMTGHVPRMRAIQFQADADILLLIIGVIPKDRVLTYGVASKVFDYMIAKKRVLAISDKGPVSELVERTNIGVVVEPTDIEGMKQYLSDALEAFSAGQLHVKPIKEEIDKYDCRNLTGQLVDSFHAIMRA
jgi:glycosyltransferase involved in cell wall biosynthesis